jgi:beta-lactamase regulating signal transducer with metallopeptidase domain
MKDAGEILFLTLAHGTVLAAAAYLLSLTPFVRARPGLVAALWTVVLLKFLLPFGPAMPYSLSDVIEALRSGGGAAPVEAVPVVVVPAAGAPVAPSTPLWMIVLFAAWIAGAVVLATRAVRVWRSATRTARALPPAPPQLAAEVALLARRLRAPVPALRIGADGTTPYVVGALRPILVLPAALAAPHRVIDRAAIVSHELAHLRRRDPYVAIVQAFAAAVLWFYPVVWFVNRRINAAREAACDLWAIARGPLAREQYARLLLSYARVPAPAAVAALAAPGGQLGARIDNVLDRRARAGVGPIGLALVPVWIALGLGGARTAEARGAAPVCVFTTAVATTLLAAHPEADLDGDGTLSRAEACELQAELRRKVDDGEVVLSSVPTADAVDDFTLSAEDAAVRAALAEPICCNCGAQEGTSSAAASVFVPAPREQACVIEGDSP